MSNVADFAHDEHDRTLLCLCERMGSWNDLDIHRPSQTAQKTPTAHLDLLTLAQGLPPRVSSSLNHFHSASSVSPPAGKELTHAQYRYRPLTSEARAAQKMLSPMQVNRSTNLRCNRPLDGGRSTTWTRSSFKSSLVPPQPEDLTQRASSRKQAGRTSRILSEVCQLDRSAANVQCTSACVARRRPSPSQIFQTHPRILLRHGSFRVLIALLALSCVWLRLAVR